MFRTVGLALIAFTALPANGTRQPAHSPESMSMVGRGVISTAAPEFALTVMPDGSELYFDRASADRRTFAIMVSRRTGTGWGEPEVVPFSGTWRDADPFITPDGKRLYFSSNRPRANGRDSSFNTWYVERQGSGWSSPIDPGSPLNSDSTDIFVTATRSGDIVFSSARQGPSRIYRASPNGSSWSEPVALELTPGDGLSNPAISPDGRLLVLARPVPGRGADLFFSCMRGVNWTPLVALPEPINSRWTEFAPSIDASGTTLYFTSERPGIVPVQPDSVRPPGDLYEVPMGKAGIACP